MGATMWIFPKGPSRSEIVVPVFDAAGAVKAVLDIDSRELAAFSDNDVPGLEKIASLL